MSATIRLFDMGGTPRANVALAVAMFATVAPADMTGGAQ